MLWTTFPQTITHDKVLVDCDAEIGEFLDTMDILAKSLALSFFSFHFSAEVYFQIGNNRGHQDGWSPAEWDDVSSRV